MAPRLLLIALLFTLLACTKELKIGYKIKNITNEQITVKYVLSDQPMDTTVKQINKGTTELLFVHETTGAFKWYEEDLDTISVFEYLEISNGETFSQKVWKDGANWQPQRTGAQSGNFIFAVASDDF